MQGREVLAEQNLPFWLYIYNNTIKALMSPHAVMHPEGNSTVVSLNSRHTVHPM